jgi:hypothetical protein
MSILPMECLDCYCDECQRTYGKDENEFPTGPGYDFPTSYRRARKLMAVSGWKYVRSGRRMVDLCPKCANKTAEERPETGGKY